uniref:Integrase catalytic domain-containing protein n=1 Tax=Vitis vinifera TaxID=29760 RepID=A5AJD8_VITVI|nr:hypothetical protein VITISV_043416 [Vitis vinifera]
MYTPDIAFVVGMLGRYLSNPRSQHWKAAKKVLRYLQGTTDLMLTYRRTNILDVVGFCDADFAGCIDDKKSTTSYIFMMVGGVVSWKSVKQTLTTSSTMEAEYVACYEACCHAMWMRNFISTLGVVDSISRPLKLFCDNSTAVAFSKNTRSISCSKHIDVKFYFVKEKVVESLIDIEHMSTKKIKWTTWNDYGLARGTVKPQFIYYEENFVFGNSNRYLSKCNSLKRVEAITGCCVYIRGKGSIKDPKKGLLNELSTMKLELDDEARRKKLGISSNIEALVIERQRRSKSRKPSNDYNCDKSRGKSKSLKEIKCFHYDKLGHIKRKCKKIRREQFKGKCEEQKEDKDIVVVASDGDTTIVCDDACVNLACQDSTWVVDTAMSFHITTHKDFFSSYTSGSFGWVRMGNEAKCEIVGMRDVELETSIGCKMVFKDVRHVPEMCFSLISIGKFDDEGYHSHLGEEKNTLYKTKARLVKGEVNIVENEASTELWHKRLSHISEKGLQVLTRKKFLPIKGTSLLPCTHCLSGKQSRVAFHKFPSRRKPDILDLVHFDVCTMQSNTLGGALYYVTFIDDHSRKVWAYALKSKYQALDVFKDFHVKIERQTGKQLKYVRVYNGHEYRGPFEQYCRSHGIKLEKIVHKTPQQNDVAKKMNRTICDRIRCMLSHAKLLKSFRGEAMRTTIDLINLSPSYPLEGDLPKRVLTRKFVSFEHLRVFGCRTFVHVPRDEWYKLDSKTKQCIFLGYSNEEFGYRLWDSATKKIIKSRDVVFFKDQTIEDLD